MVDIDEGRKPMASWRIPPGRRRNVWLNKVHRRMPTPYRYLRCGDPRSPGVTERRNGPLGLYVVTIMIDVPVARLLGERDLRTRRRS